MYVCVCMCVCVCVPCLDCGVVRNIRLVMADKTVSSMELKGGREGEGRK